MNMYGVADSVPYAQWPNEGLLRLYHDLGRNGRLSEDQERIETSVKEILEGRGVDLSKAPVGA